ncbi:uncharacterized protein LOC141866586 [Acropora palmata]|uniref:uncharacterized protein LOC141866586 n=1 Tax=Acropora palmata TaxID=6131 RepID=UPI003DA1B891
MNEVGCTSGIGWPVSLKLFKCGGNVYFDCQAVLDLCGIERQIKKHGFKFIDKFLLDNGIPNSFIYSKNQRSRELISYSAVIMLVIRYQGTENKADELRKFLLKPLLLPPALLQQSSTCTTSTISPTVVLSTLNESPSTPARNCQPPTLACHSPAVTRNLSAVLSSVPNVLSSTCPSTLVGGPIHSTVEESLLLVLLCNM